MVGRRYSFRGLQFWAELGLVRLEDQKDGSYFVITRREALLRAQAINEEISHSSYASERSELQNLVQNMIECVKEAKTQGDPMDMEVRQSKSKEIKRARSAKLLLPSGFVPGKEKVPTDIHANTHHQMRGISLAKPDYMQLPRPAGIGPSRTKVSEVADCQHYLVVPIDKDLDQVAIVDKWKLDNPDKLLP